MFFLTESGAIANPIVAADKVVLQLEDTLVQLTAQLTKAEEDIKENDDMVRKLMKEGKKLIAMTYLKKKKFCEKRHGEKRSRFLLNSLLLKFYLFRTT